MKVVGHGAPRALTVRVQPCEFGLWREELRRRLVAVSEHHANAAELMSGTWSPSEPPPADKLGDDHEAVQLSRLLERMHIPVAAGQPRILVGPTWLLAHVIRSVATLAIDRYVDAGRAFCAGDPAPAAHQLRAALECATACTATLISLRQAETEPDQR